MPPPPDDSGGARGQTPAASGRSSSSRGATTSFVKRYRTEIAASTSSVFSTLAAFPLDSVKTRMQTYQYRGFLDCVKHTYHTEKFSGFFRGMSLHGLTNIEYFGAEI